MTSPRVLLSGGGTGGHIFPAVSIAQEIQKRFPDAEFMFIGALGKMEMEKVPQAGFKIEGLDIAGFDRGNILSNFKLPFRLLSSISKAKKIIRNFKPDFAIGTGGFASGPALWAASQLGVPTFIQEQNSFPGVTNKILSKKAKAVFTAYPGTGKIWETAILQADVIVSRAGAIAISELAVAVKPILLIPLPTAAEDHQTKNAQSLVDQKAAFMQLRNLKILDYFTEKGFTIMKRAKVLGILTETTECVAVAGTHGKTTTSTLIAHLCKVANLPFSGFLGGIAENYGSNFIFNGTDISVVEADEYDRSFMNLRPKWAVVTSMDADHLDIYGDKNTIEESFRDFAGLVPEDQQLFVRKGLDIGRESVSYAVNEEADYYSDHIRMEGGTLRFDFHAGDETIEDFEWHLPGIHNVENATVAIAIVHQLGASYEDLKKGIKSFKGIKRRYTKHFFENGKIYIDDYAHHPTELNAVIGSIKTFYPDKKLLIVFQPHLFTRTRDFVDGFAESLSKGEELILLDIYPARELPIEGVTSDWLLEKVKSEKKEISSLQDAFEKIKNKEFDILLTVGAGNIDTLYDPIMEWMGKKRVNRNERKELF
ncbi:hypothetical protein FQR65_LT18595 [Abscondita terminalis]|nr:hypothetical protein FQR65_LT18595 [Abscondita terminalis]